MFEANFEVTQISDIIYQFVIYAIYLWSLYTSVNYGKLPLEYNENYRALNASFDAIVRKMQEYFVCTIKVIIIP